MKGFAYKHPIIALLMLKSVCGTLTTSIKAITGYHDATVSFNTPNTNNKEEADK